MAKIKLIYNPHAGSKKHIFARTNFLLLQDIYALLYKYEIDFDTSPILKEGDARRLAREAASDGYEYVIVAGGDGTVGEAATGLVGSNTALAILPLGTYMNVAKMLSIPLNLESAVMVIKMGNIRSIDVGEVISLKEEQVDGKAAREANYFLESVGIGIEADFQNFLLTYKKNRWHSIVELVKGMKSFYNAPLSIELDNDRIIESKAQLIMISNGPFMGANLSVAPTSKLNDHVLKVTIYKMTNKKLLWHIFKLKMTKQGSYLRSHNLNPAIQTYTSTFVNIKSKKTRPVDADARIYGETPISVKVRPGALKVIVGFAGSKKDSALLEKNVYIKA
ncbi:MAG: YegS/Rv2252/BmrU family lipid kinase [Patescibacteria group bacterium]|jgi:diacylglycerol kinase (ATP)